ncbi:hypothetical protein DFA_03751 [Cavenderia fasciculata]|uniref:Uncharacterized protein n=1 Tax=Cavenderia fasciculata TaxID=261658 RepID=F4Q0A8_CACFS|nr:uncharacterized protein DFA_03751 [Cavenderia fasciculata]EGG18259.1 hypothetical protein DFA_03751 [Cavenderia fasciculata]|eukprot:XP_004357082.1 hypothetical protein DFA_03751 [Cavenderia fasciculata]
MIMFRMNDRVVGSLGKCQNYNLAQGEYGNGIWEETTHPQK